MEQNLRFTTQTPVLAPSEILFEIPSENEISCNFQGVKMAREIVIINDRKTYLFSDALFLSETKISMIIRATQILLCGISRQKAEMK